MWAFLLFTLIMGGIIIAIVGISGVSPREYLYIVVDNEPVTVVVGRYEGSDKVRYLFSSFREAMLVYAQDSAVYCCGSMNYEHTDSAKEKYNCQFVGVCKT